jgi:hypothetical protein
MKFGAEQGRRRPKRLIEHIRQISDPRIEKKCRHKLEDIVAISICAILCGADDWNAIDRVWKSQAGVD